MSNPETIDFTYRYPSKSTAKPDGAGTTLHLAAGNREEPTNLLDTALRQPRLVADLLSALHEISSDLDPLVTTSDLMVRFEGLSANAGVYARIDLIAEAFQAELTGRGSAPVDFNAPFCEALGRLGVPSGGSKGGKDSGDVRLVVGADAAEAPAEKTVALSTRWIRSFSQVQLIQADLTPRYKFRADEGERFIGTLEGASSELTHVVLRGRSLELAEASWPGAIAVSGLVQLPLLVPLLAEGWAFRVWHDDATHTTAWEVILEPGRFFLMVSPEASGFIAAPRNGETASSEAVDKVREALFWQSRIDTDALTDTVGLSPGEIKSALAQLAADGYAGYDVVAGAFFHRELPFSSG